MSKDSWFLFVVVGVRRIQTMGYLQRGYLRTCPSYSAGPEQPLWSSNLSTAGSTGSLQTGAPLTLTVHWGRYGFRLYIQGGFFPQKKLWRMSAIWFFRVVLLSYTRITLEGEVEGRCLPWGGRLGNWTGTSSPGNLGESERNSFSEEKVGVKVSLLLSKCEWKYNYARMDMELNRNFITWSLKDNFNGRIKSNWRYNWKLK